MRPTAHLPAGYGLVFFERLDSTNDEAKRRAAQGAPSGTVVWALAQSGGRGRRGRRWISEPGNLYASILVRPEVGAARAMRLSFVAALAVAEAIDAIPAARGRVACKWPNDILLDGRKIAGLLLEAADGGRDRLAWLVVGIGVNLAHCPAETEFPATSLVGAGLEAVEPGIMLGRCLAHFDAWFRRWRDQGFAPVRAAWLGRARGRGEIVRVRLEERTLEGRFVDLDADGALVLDGPEGRRHITSGDVFLGTQQRT